MNSKREKKRDKDNSTPNNSSTIKTKKNQKKKKKKKLGKIILLLFLIAVLIAVGLLVYRTQKNGGGLKGFLSTVVGQDEITKKELNSIDFLVLGESGGLSDTIIACTYDPNTQKASMLSIPRDTFVGKSEATASPSDKINSIYNRTKDPMKTIAAVNNLTGLNLKYYVLVDTKALRELVDAIGGVYFDVPMDMYYEDTSEENYLIIDLKKGYQKLNGSQAEQLVRFRHNSDGSTYPIEYGEQDIGRMRTQREFLMAVMKQTLSLGNIFKIGNFIDIAQNNVKTNISFSLMKDYIPYAVEFNMENLQTGALPGVTDKFNGYWFYIKSNSDSQKVINQFFFDGLEEEAIDTTTPTVQILNGTSNPENLEKVVAQIKSLGYQVVKVGNTTTISKTSILNRTKQSEEIENNITQVLGCGTVKTGKDNVNADFTITIGKDYK